MALEWAALIVFGIWAVAAAAMAVLGRNQIKSFDPKLSTTQKTLKEDVPWAKNQK
jgi:hypothetical protein